MLTQTKKVAPEQHALTRAHLQLHTTEVSRRQILQDPIHNFKMRFLTTYEPNIPQKHVISCILYARSDERQPTATTMAPGGANAARTVFGE